MNFAGKVPLTKAPERRLLLSTRPAVWNRFLEMADPSPEERSALAAIYFLMEAVSMQLLAFLETSTPVLARLELLLRSSYRVQIWSSDRTVRLENGSHAAERPFISSCSYSGFIQVSSNLF